MIYLVCLLRSEENYCLYSATALCSEEVETLILSRNPPAYAELLALWICVQQSF